MIKDTLKSFFSSFFFVPVKATHFSLNICVVHGLCGSSIFTSASQHSDKVLLNPNRSETKPKYHVSLVFPLRDFLPVQLSWSYLGHCANKEHPLFKLGAALRRILVQGFECRARDSSG